MNSANSLLGISNKVTKNVPSTNPLSVADVPVMNSVRTLRNIKFQDQYYADQRMSGQMKNTEGTLGANNKFLTRKDYDRQIDPNYLRRENPRNKKHTDPADFYNGSQLAYFELPRKIPRAQIIDPTVGAIDSMNQYQYKNRFISNKQISTPEQDYIGIPDTPDTDTTETIVADETANGIKSIERMLRDTE